MVYIILFIVLEFAFLSMQHTYDEIIKWYQDLANNYNDIVKYEETIGAHIKTFVKFAILSYCKLTQVNYYVQVLKCMVHTPQKSVIHFILALQINVLTQFGWI